MGGRGTPGNAASVMQQQQPYEAVSNNPQQYLTRFHSLEVVRAGFTHCKVRQTQQAWLACQEEVVRLTNWDQQVPKLVMSSSISKMETLTRWAMRLEAGLPPITKSNYSSSNNSSNTAISRCLRWSPTDWLWTAVVILNSSTSTTTTGSLLKPPRSSWRRDPSQQTD